MRRLFDRIALTIYQKAQAENVLVVCDEYNAIKLRAVISSHNRAMRFSLPRPYGHRCEWIGVRAREKRDDQQDGGDTPGELLHSREQFLRTVLRMLYDVTVASLF